MALTPERINELKEQAVSAWRAAGFEPMLQVFVAHAIETEVRKSDEALILQLVEAIAYSTDHDHPHYEDQIAALDEGRARLVGKP